MCIRDSPSSLGRASDLNSDFALGFAAGKETGRIVSRDVLPTMNLSGARLVGITPASQPCAAETKGAEVRVLCAGGALIA